MGEPVKPYPNKVQKCIKYPNSKSYCSQPQPIHKSCFWEIREMFTNFHCVAFAEKVKRKINYQN